MKTRKCEDPRCEGKQTLTQCFRHSAKLYCPEKLPQEYYWACNTCVTVDHENWERNNLGRINKVEVIQHD